MSTWETTTLLKIRWPFSITAAAVSSQELSMLRIFIGVIVSYFCSGGNFWLFRQVRMKIFNKGLINVGQCDRIGVRSWQVR